MPNLEIIQKFYHHFENKELDKVRPLFHKNIKWNQMKGFPKGGNYVGTDEIFENVFKEFNDNWTGWKSDVIEFIDAGDSILVVGVYRGTYNNSGKYLEADFINRYTLNAGIITHVKQFTDTGLFFKVMKGGKQQAQLNNPLHSIKLTEILEFLLEEYGWDGLARRININCFKSNQTIKSSLIFLRKFDWARQEVEDLYLATKRN